MGLDQYMFTNSKNLAKKMVEFDKKHHEWLLDECGHSKSGLIGYWRKDNAIHKFFIDNVQNGVDDQRTSLVQWSMICELRDACVKVLETVKYDDDGKPVSIDADVAEEILPTQEGFFFGTYGYDERYIYGLEYTRDLINEIEKYITVGEYGRTYCEDEPDWNVDFYYGCWW